MAKSVSPSASIDPRAAVHPISGGSAPGTAPMIVLRVVTRLSGV